MNVTGQEDKSFSSDDLLDSRDIIIGGNDIVFAHEATLGDKTIDLNSLVTPSEMASNGFVNPSASQIASAQLAIFKKRLDLKSTRGQLTQCLDYIITDSGSIVFVNTLGQTGALDGEIFIGKIRSFNSNAVVVTDARSFDVTISCPDDVPVGTTLINVGTEYEINANPLYQTGAIKPSLNGKRIYRNVGNAPASLTADGNYHEVSNGEKFGTQMELNTPMQDGDILGIDFGLSIGSGDLQIFNSLEMLQGALIKLAQDAANDIHGDNDITRYLAANPTALERRAFGDLLLKLNSLYNTSKTLSEFARYKYTTFEGINPQTFNHDTQLQLTTGMSMQEDEAGWWNDINKRYDIQKDCYVDVSLVVGFYNPSYTITFAEAIIEIYNAQTLVTTTYKGFVSPNFSWAQPKIDFNGKLPAGSRIVFKAYQANSSAANINTIATTSNQVRTKASIKKLDV